MYYELYLDSYFFLNFVLEYFALLQTGRMFGYEKKTMRCIGGAAFGAALSCVLLLLPRVPALLKQTAGTFCISLVTVWLVFRMKKAKQYFQAVLFFYIFTFLIGGILLWLRGVTRFVWKRELPLWMILAVSMLLSKVSGKAIRCFYQKNERRMMTVRLSQGKNSISLQALLDTGNSLREPFSGKPVCITERRVLEDVIGREEMKEHPEKKRIIPYHSIGKAHGMMEGYEIENMIVCTDGTDTVIKGAVIGISDENIAAGREYQMILNPAVLQGRK